MGEATVPGKLSHKREVGKREDSLGHLTFWEKVQRKNIGNTVRRNLWKQGKAALLTLTWALGL